MDILDKLTEDLNWRESEIASFRILLSKSDITRTQHEALLRAAWALLYAHYEGFTKFCLTVFFDSASKQSDRCRSLPYATRAFALEGQIKSIRSANTIQAIDLIENIFSVALEDKPVFPEVDTKSNLWPNVLDEILIFADINEDLFDGDREKIKTLVARRNDIAHGQRNKVDDIGYYLTFEDAVLKFFYRLIFCVERRLLHAPYT